MTQFVMEWGRSVESFFISPRHGVQVSVVVVILTMTTKKKKLKTNVLFTDLNEVYGTVVVVYNLSAKILTQLTM